MDIYDVMRDRIIESKWAFYWARNIGDLEIMKVRVIDRRWL